MTDAKLKEWARDAPLIASAAQYVHQMIAARAGILRLFDRLQAVEQERDAARKSAEFQRRRADRGWFLYERTLTEFIDFKESLPEDET